MLLSFEEVAFINYLRSQVLEPSKAIVLAILEHSMVDVVVSLLNPVSVSVTAVELASVHSVVGRVKCLLSVTRHLAIEPLTLVPFASGYHQLHSNAILLAVFDLTLIDIAIVELDLANAFNLVVVPDSLVDSTALVDEAANSVLDHPMVLSKHFSLVDVSVSIMKYLDI